MGKFLVVYRKQKESFFKNLISADILSAETVPFCTKGFLSAEAEMGDILTAFCRKVFAETIFRK